MADRLCFECFLQILGGTPSITISCCSTHRWLQLKLTALDINIGEPGTPAVSPGGWGNFWHRFGVLKEYVASLTGLYRNNGAVSCVGIDFHLIKPLYYARTDA